MNGGGGIHPLLPFPCCLHCFITFSCSPEYNLSLAIAPTRNLLCEELRLIRISCLTLNSSILVLIFTANEALSRSPTPENLVKWHPHHALPSSLIRCVSRRCKECPLAKLANWIFAYNYGEPNCHVFKSSFTWEGKILDPTLADITCSRIKTT